MAYLSQSESPLPSPAPESWSGPARVNISIASSPDALGCPWGPWPWFRWRQIKSEKFWKHVRKVKSWSRWTSRLPDFPTSLAYGWGPWKGPWWRLQVQSKSLQRAMQCSFDCGPGHLAISGSGFYTADAEVEMLLHSSQLGENVFSI